jgi:serine/alanine adding enzyme
VLEVFPDRVRIFVVRAKAVPLAAAVVIGFKDSLWNPWASSLREFASLSPNMLLYWAMLEYGCEHGFRWFDFGRSTCGEGTYRFKEQWGARPFPLHWYTFSTKPRPGGRMTAEGISVRTAAEYWRRLPVPLTRVLGPKIRKYISL